MADVACRVLCIKTTSFQGRSSPVRPDTHTHHTHHTHLAIKMTLHSIGVIDTFHARVLDARPRSSSHRVGSVNDDMRDVYQMMCAYPGILNCAHSATGNTALIVAALDGADHRVPWLLHKGADPLHINADGMSFTDVMRVSASQLKAASELCKVIEDRAALHADRFDHIRASNIIKRHGMIIAYIQPHGQFGSALHIAIKVQNVMAIDFLLSAVSINPNAMNRFHLTPLDMASIMLNSPSSSTCARATRVIVDVLMARGARRHITYAEPVSLTNASR